MDIPEIFCKFVVMKRNLKVTFDFAREATVMLPASKSISNRVLVMNALAGGGGRISNVAVCDDTDAMQRALRETGGYVNIGAAGTAMRFLTAYFAGCEGRTVTLDGTARMRQRPIGVLVDALRQCGAKISYEGEAGFPPLRIEGQRLHADGPVELAGNVSSQYISALMMVAPYMDGGLTLRLKGGMISRPYIEMTASLMRRFGGEVEVADGEVRIAPQRYVVTDFSVESDWSAASYWYEMQTLIPQLKVRLSGLQQRSVQGDSRVAEFFACLGVETVFTDCGVQLNCLAGQRPARVDFDLSGQPDLAQTLVVTACLADIPFRMTGLSTLKIKETDRIEALRSQLAKLGYPLEVEPDYSLRWDGRRTEPQENPEIETFDDHRMAMAFAPVAVKFPGLVILDAGVVSKSYPDYWKHLSEVGFSMEEKE